jgi:hypothetical protein
MCFWFDVEILRLVYEKVFFFNRMVSILHDFLSSKKVAPQELKKYFFKIWRTGYQKKRTDFKNVQMSRVWQKGKKFVQKLIF